MRSQLFLLFLLVQLARGQQQIKQFVMLPSAAPTQGLIMNKHDLTPAGFSIITSDDPAYDIELRRLGFGANLDALAVKPFSVILKNFSTRSVVAFAIKWTVSDALGNTISREFSYIQPSALLDGGKTKREKAPIEHQIRPGASRLVTVNGMVRSADELHDLAVDSSIGVVKNVFLDLAIFDDGEAVGSNELGLMERFAAFVNAEQDLMQEVDSRISKGEALTPILKDIRSRLAPDTGALPVTPAALYDHNFRIYLNELETTNKNAGEEVAKDVVTHRKYAARPTIHKGANPNNLEVK